MGAVLGSARRVMNARQDRGKNMTDDELSKQVAKLIADGGRARLSDILIPALAAGIIMCTTAAIVKVFF